MRGKAEPLENPLSLACPGPGHTYMPTEWEVNFAKLTSHQHFRLASTHKAVSFVWDSIPQ